MKLFIESRHNGYNPAQCGKTMTVGEFIKYLQDYDADTELYIKNDNGYTYGNIDTRSFSEEEDAQ